MENYFVYNDPIRIVWRKGNAEEPYVDKVESQKVINNMVVLTEIPDEFTHVSINGYTEIYDGTPSADQFIVNYENGVITFNPSKEGSTIVNMTYKGRGFILYPASRIYSHNENPNVVVTLQEIIDASDVALDALAKLVVVIANAEAATAKAITQADYAKVQGDYAKAQGDYSKSSGDALAFKGTYAAATAYVARNMVYYNGATYMATTNTTGNAPTNVSFWKKIGSMVWKGTYSTAVTYTYGDFVTDGTNYNLYMSIFETNTNQPLTNVSYWNKMISVQSVADATVLATTNANTATTQANNARDAANAAKAAADTATGLANTATSNANTATTQANAARDGANAAAIAANTAKTNADTARDGANAAAAAANTAKANADIATGLANTATSAANTATGLANTATTQANAARDGANTARDSANAAATAANTAKTNADTATTQANAARDAANIAATNANTKADYAQTQGNYAKDVGDSLVHKGEYSASLAYVVRNLVYYNGVTYMCIANSAAGILPTNATYWRKITAFNWKGTYSTATTYQYGDFVVDATNQKLYICVKDGTINIALTTTANWNPIFDISTVVASANTAITQANAARDAANTAKTAADTATGLANTATTNANAARDAANTAATNANTKADYAQTQGDYAKDQGSAANTATTVANIATTQANAARDAANTAKTNADTATGLANAATTNANNAATAANTAKTNADTATGLANTATTNANNAATNANTVAGRTSAKGAYSASTTYYPNNVVTYNGSSYMCTVQALNKVPTDTGFWQLVALKGNDGTGSVVGLTSTNSDIVIAGTVQNPDLAISTTLKSLWSDKYTKAEVNTLINQATSGNEWKPSVANYAAIATTYPNPQDGWTVNVNDTDYTYRYTGSAWIAISANSIPNASASTDGKLSATLFNKLTAISAQATRTINSTTNGNILVDGVESVVYTHPTGAGNNHIPTGGAANNFLKYSASGTAVWATPTLSGLAETVIASPTSGQVLRHNGTNWVNATLTFNDISSGASNGTLVTNLNADMVDGFHASIAGTGSTIVARSPGGGVEGVVLHSTTPNGNAPMFIASSTMVTNLNSNYLEGYRSRDFSKRINLEGQLQKTSYMRSVIALCELTNTNPSANSYTNGTLSFHRTNGLEGQYNVTIMAEKKYNSTTFNYSSVIAGGSNVSGVRACTFTYNGIKYGGIEVFFTAAEYSQIEFNGATNFGIFGLDYAVTSPVSVLNSEINDSLNFVEPLIYSGFKVGDRTLTVNQDPYSIALRDQYGGLNAVKFNSYAAQGTAPFYITSTTMSPNLNADMVDGYHFNQALLTTSAPTFAGLTSNGQFYLNSNLNMSSTAPVLSFNETDQALNEKLWWVVPDAKIFSIRTVTDAGGSGVNAMSIVRGTGTAVASVQFPNIPVQAASFASTVAQGTAPFQVTSNTVVPILNVDMVDGFHVSTANTAGTLVARDTLGAINVSKVFATTTSKTGSYFQKHLGSFTTTQNVANEKIDIIFTAPMSGYVDVVICGAYGYQASFGQLRKRLVVYTGTMSNGTIYFPESAYTETLGLVSTSHAISDLFYDSASQTYRIRISKTMAMSGNVIQVYIEGLASNDTYANGFESGTLSTISTSDTTIPETPVRTFLKATTFTDKVTLGAAQGTAPLVVASTTVVSNFNADMVDGKHATYSDPDTIVVRTANGGIFGTVDLAENNSVAPANGVWYRIAETEVNIGSNNARFEIRYSGVASGIISFEASMEASGNAHISQTSYSTYGAAGFKKARVVYHTTSTGNYAYVEVYKVGASLNFYTRMTNSKGWKLLATSSLGSIPSGYTSSPELTFVDGFSTTGAISTNNLILTAAQGTPAFTVASNTMIPNLNATMVGGFSASATSGANLIPVRDANKKIAEVSATRANIVQVAVPTSNTPISMVSYGGAVKGNFTVYVYLTITAVSTVEVKITYSDNGGPNSQTIYVQPSKTLTPDSYSYLPIYLSAIPVGTISVVVTSNNSSATLVSATIKEE